MRVLVSGASGLVGSGLVASLQLAGHEVFRLVRNKREPSGHEIPWDPDSGAIDAPALEGMDAAVHLSGENIAAGRWTTEKKKRIRDSRVKTTAVLSEAFADLERPPRVLVCASAVGYYGDRGQETLAEESAPGAGFLAEVCIAWERATQPAADHGIRVVNARFGAVLSKEGGALARMLPAFRLGLGGTLGDGRQYMPWIVIDDAVGVICHAIAHETLQGPVDAVAPQSVTNHEFTKTLGRVLGRPTVFRIPAFALRLLFGELADMLLASARVQSQRLAQSGYLFAYPELEPALRHVLGIRP